MAVLARSRPKRSHVYARLRCRLRALGLVWFFVLPSAAQTSLSLHEAVAQALASPAVQVADARVDEAKGTVTQSKLGPNPRLFLQSEDLQPWSDNFSFANQTEDYGYVGQILETAGKRGKRVMLARAREHQAEAERAVQLRLIAGRVSTTYWSAAGLDRIAGLLRQEMTVVEEMVRYHQQRVDAGAMRGIDLLRMQIERDRLALSLAAAEREAAQAQLELFRQMGRAPGAAVTLSDRLEDVPLLPPITLEQALQSRPDLDVAREAVQTANADLRLQQSLGVPDPDVFAGYKRNSTDNTAYAAVQIPLPVRNRNQGEVARARASVAAAQAALILLERQVGIQIAQAQQAYEMQRKITQEVLPDLRSKTAENLKITAEAYRLGGVDLLRFIDAERTAFEVEVSAIRTLAELQQSVLQLRLAYGVQP